MIEVILYNRDAWPVEVVLIPPSAVDGDGPEVIAWGSRLFVRTAEGWYREGTLLQVYTAREWKAMERGD